MWNSISLNRLQGRGENLQNLITCKIHHTSNGQASIMLTKLLNNKMLTSLRATSRAAARRHASRHVSTFAVAFDIDGVLYRGSDDIAPAKAVIETLRKKNIPVLFLTNGGGLTEALKVKHLGKRLGVNGLKPEQMFQSHTPMKQLDEYKDKLVLAVGKDQAKHILET